MAGAGSDVLANVLETSLTAGKDFNLTIPDLSDGDYNLPDHDGPLYEEIKALTVEDLTTGSIEGDGVFDKLMRTVAVHIHKEYDKQRIAGNEYSKVYIASIQGAMQTAVQFLLGKDQAYWQAALIQSQTQAAEIAVITARVNLVTAKLQAYMMKFQALTAEVNYALTKLKLATEDQGYAQLKAQVDLTNAQIDLVKEQLEVQRAQTMNTRTDGQVIVGVLGKQKELLSQQITSYQRDAEVKAAKMFVDAWITQKTIDEGLVAPVGFTNASLDTVLTKLKSNNGLT